MLIDKAKIQAAKEKLGDKSAELIAEILNLQEYDTKNHKSCCPFHSEKTASFIYNPKNYNYHCFGSCGTNTDIIDAYMKTGLSYIESIQKLFELADIKYSFGEYKVKTKAQYKYPKEVDCNNKDKVYAYLQTRGISKETADYADIRQDEHGNVVFNYYDTNDVLTMVKYRKSCKIEKGEPKMWCQPGADTTPLLFNMNRINTSSPLLVTEGEADCLAVIEAGFQNVVSIPLGAGNYHWIEENWDWLEEFSSIIIASDNDEAGLKMQKEVVYRLGSWRTKVVEIPPYYEKPDGTKVNVKDLNEVLFLFGKEKLLEIILNAKDTPVPTLVDFADVDDLDLNDIDGVKTGIKALDKEIMKIFYSTLTIVSGTPSSGKTSFMYQLIANAADENTPVFLYSREMPERMTRNWMNFTFASARHVQEYKTSDDCPYYVVPKEVKKQIGEHYRGRLFFYKDECDNSLSSIQQSMVDSVRKYGVKMLILDNLTAINISEKSDDIYAKQTELVTWLIHFSMKYNVATILLAHPKKMPDVTINVGQYDISGSSNMINLAHRSLGLRRVSKAEKKGVQNQKNGGWVKEPVKQDVIINVIKDRFLGKNGFELPMYYDLKSRRFFTNQEEYEHQYEWDKNSYSDKLLYPIIDEEGEIFGSIKKTN